MARSTCARRTLVTRNGLSALAPVVTVLMASVWLAIGCGLAGTYGSLSATQQTIVGGTPSIADSSAAALTPGPLPAAPSSRPSPPTSRPASVEPTASAQPPDGRLSVAGTVVTGHLGTFCWQRACSDEFELPPTASLPLVTVSATDGQLSFDLAPEVAFTKWTASYSSRTMADVIPIAGGGSLYDPDSSATPPPPVGSVEFSAPPAGEWVLVVTVHFAMRPCSCRVATRTTPGTSSCSST